MGLVDFAPFWTGHLDNLCLAVPAGKDARDWGFATTFVCVCERESACARACVFFFFLGGGGGGAVV